MRWYPALNEVIWRLLMMNEFDVAKCKLHFSDANIRFPKRMPCICSELSKLMKISFIFRANYES